jgi:hypothetical protein
MMRPGGGKTRPMRGQTAGAPAVPGVIETIATGLSLALVYPLLALLPLLNDALVWSGLHIAPAALDEGSLGRDFLESMGLADDLLLVLGFFVPSLLAWIDRDRLFTSGDGLVWSLDSTWLVLLVGFGLLLAVGLAHALFKVPIAYVLRHEAMSPVHLIRSVALTWLRLIGLGALVAGVLTLLTLPVAVAGGLLYLMGVNAAPLIVLAIFLPVVVAAIFLVFASDAIAYSEIGPFRACYLSFNVVRRNFWPVLGLVGSITLISRGLPALWLSQAEHPIGLLIGVFCNALMAAGLAAASMQFYADRLGRWQRSESASPAPVRPSMAAPS